MATKTSKNKEYLSKDLVPRLQDSIISRINVDQTISLVNLELDDFCYSLDGIASEVWTLIDGKISLGEIENILVKKHKPPLDRFASDMGNLIENLKKENLISF